jgi:hypothetical protein
LGLEICPKARPFTPTKATAITIITRSSLKEVGLHLKAQRKNRSKRPMAAWEEFLSKSTRQYIETVFSKLSAMFARRIHAVTPRGFELKIVCFLLAYSIQCL